MPWLTSNVLKQGKGEPLTALPVFDDGPDTVRFRHIVHFYRDKLTPRNTDVQSITFDTIRSAARYSDQAARCVAVTFPEDTDIVPRDMVLASPLRRSVTDVDHFSTTRHLPLLFDVLNAGAQADADWNDAAGTEYIVLTNSDIHVQPIFYSALASLIRQGFDVITCNRRTIDVDAPAEAFSTAWMADQGMDHPGFDCFVFPAAMLPRFVTSRSCCGAGNVMRTLLFNLVAHSQRFLMLTEAHLTFHLGDDRPWSQPAFNEYEHFNVAEGHRALRTLLANETIAAPLAEFVRAHEMGIYGSVLDPD